jgi:ABC-type multidrug transport system ATPase subunit
MSLGQKKKLSFALAFARNAKHIILDEPENGLDNESRLVVRKLIQDAADNGASVLISSHDLTNVEDMCDTIIMIDKGKIIYTDSIDDILENASKWLIKATDTSDLDAYVLQQEDDVMTVVLLRDRVTAREYLLSKNTTIIDSLKVELIDTYMALKEVGNNE